MTQERQTRRGFLGRLAAAVGGLAAVPALATPALAGKSRRRYGGWGYPGGYWRGSSRRFRRLSTRRFRAYRPYGGYYGAPGYYGGPGYYGRPGVRVFVGPRPYYGGYGYGVPLMHNAPPASLDPLSLLEA